MKKLAIIVGVILGVIIILVVSRPSLSYTPKGIDPTPLYNLQLPDDLDVSTAIFSNDFALAKKYQCQLKYDNWIFIYTTNDTNKYKYLIREVVIMQFENHNDALKQYSDSKEFRRNISKIYKEEEHNNRYFMAYSPIDIGFCHGIPIPLLTNFVCLDFGFLINNYYAYISYRDLGGEIKKTYKDIANNDIILVSELFNEVLEKYKESQ